MGKYARFFCITVLICSFSVARGQEKERLYSFEFCDATFNMNVSPSMMAGFNSVLSENAIQTFYAIVNSSDYRPLTDSLKAYKQKNGLNDWLYYQLIRRAAQQISPKADNYYRYTLYKWFLLNKSGYDARLAISNDRLIFYIRNDEEIEDIPFFTVNGTKYMCLNIHDYGTFDIGKDNAVPVTLSIPEGINAFSYKITRMPDFKPENYTEKELEFSYKNRAYHFNIKLNPEVQALFSNYPGVDFASYFNIPLSKETYGSLIPLLKKNINGMSQKKGVDYLMRFTRYAFLYEDDEENFGKEKRLSPEETLFSKYSDCDDRAALFFYLVKEIYNLPMVALLYPTHITMAVQFNKPVGTPIVYKGKTYSVCEPTPQPENLHIGQLSARLKNAPYQVVYEYQPNK